MKKISRFVHFLFLVFSIAVLSGCDSSTTPTPPAGEVLLAQVQGDSTGTGGSGISTVSSTISSSTLDFTSADSMRISYSFSGTTNNTSPRAFSVYYLQNTNDTVFVATLPGSSVNLNTQSIDLTTASPRVNSSFYYRISFATTDPSGGFIKFSDLKIYKK